ncbi:MerR family transcriptional regulator [Brevibacillus fluminis]|nr:MerR family transcriptional regulator [Brevibacillus fluminis]
MVYTTSQFAEMAKVSSRTLRYYDKVGLLSPSDYSESGYRLYTDEDFPRLQHILVLKFLGFSLAEIKAFLHNGPTQLADRLSQQKKLMLAKRAQLDTVIRAMDKAEHLLQNAEPHDFEAIVTIMEVIQMEMKSDWINNYLTPEQRQTMRGLVEEAYSPEAWQRLRAQGTQDSAKSFHEEYEFFRTELRRLVAEGANPADPEAQKLATFLTELNERRSQGDPEILAGMKKSWEGFNRLPDEQKPAIYKLSDEERAFIKQMCSIMFRTRGRHDGEN